jgi:hypothetical protein
VAPLSPARGNGLKWRDRALRRPPPLENARNADGQLLDPIVDGFRAPAFRAGPQEDSYADWAGTMMANATRAPAFFATLSIANRDLIEFLNSFPGTRRIPPHRSARS